MIYGRYGRYEYGRYDRTVNEPTRQWFRFGSMKPNRFELKPNRFGAEPEPLRVRFRETEPNRGHPDISQYKHHKRICWASEHASSKWCTALCTNHDLIRHFEDIFVKVKTSKLFFSWTVSKMKITSGEVVWAAAMIGPKIRTCHLTTTWHGARLRLSVCCLLWYCCQQLQQAHPQCNSKKAVGVSTLCFQCIQGIYRSLFPNLNEDTHLDKIGQGTT